MKTFFWIVVIIVIGVVSYFVYTTQVAVPTTIGPAATTTAVADLPQIIPDIPSVKYTDPRYNFSMYYPSTATVRASGFDGFLPLTQTPVVAFSLNPDMFQGTNLSEAGVYVGASSTPAIVANCTNAIPNSDEMAATSSISINGATLNEFDSTGVGAGNIYQEKIFRSVVHGSCLEFVELLHSGNIGNYPSGTVTAFDEAQFSGILDAMLKTLAISDTPQK
jgi:hypothetical protein